MLSQRVAAWSMVRASQCIAQRSLDAAWGIFVRCLPTTTMPAGGAIRGIHKAGYADLDAQVRGGMLSRAHCRQKQRQGPLPADMQEFQGIHVSTVSHTAI